MDGAGADPALLTAVGAGAADDSEPSSPLSQPSSPSSVEAAVVAAGAATEVPVAGAVAEAAAGADEPEPEPVELLEEAPTPGFCVMSTSCWPSGIGPLGFAGQEPAGLTGLDRPNGMVPGSPTLRLPDEPTNVVGFVDWN